MSESIQKRHKRIDIGRWTGYVLLICLAIAAIVGPDLVGQSPAKQSLRDVLQGPSLAHLLGTDHLGRDMAARLLSGAQLSLSLAALSVLTASIPGTLLGIVAVWFGGWTDRIATSVADAVLALPGLLLVLMLVTISPGSWLVLYIGISLTLWVEYFRYTRQRCRIVMADPAVEASRLLGFPAYMIVLRHILPEIGPGLLTIAAFGAAAAVTAMAALSFVGVGVRPPTAEWGAMMTELLPSWRESPFLLIQPTICLLVTVLALYLSVGGIHKK